MHDVSAAQKRFGVPSEEVLDLVSGYLTDVAGRAHHRLGDVIGVALTTAVDGGAPMTTGASPDQAAEVDRVQYSIGRSIEHSRGWIHNWASRNDYSSFISCCDIGDWLEFWSARDYPNTYLERDCELDRFKCWFARHHRASVVLFSTGSFERRHPI